MSQGVVLAQHHIVASRQQEFDGGCGGGSVVDEVDDGDDDDNDGDDVDADVDTDSMSVERSNQTDAHQCDNHDMLWIERSILVIIIVKIT